MVAGQTAIGMLLLAASLVAVWQLKTYTDARQAWMETQERLSLISNVQQQSATLALITRCVAYTESPCGSGPEPVRHPTDRIGLSTDRLRLIHNELVREAESLREDDPIRADLLDAARLTDELIGMADEAMARGLADEWAAAQELIRRTPRTSIVPDFDSIHNELAGELQWLKVLTREEWVNAQEKMSSSGRTAIGVTVTVAAMVTVLGFLLSLSIIRSITEPINELSEAASRLADGAFDVRVPATRRDEFGHLAMVFNDMAAKLGEIYAGMDLQIQELRIVIDEAKQKAKLEEIIEADYFKRLRTKAAILRDIVSSKGHSAHGG